jgi:hypothetical protein
MDPDTRYGTSVLAELRDRSVPPLDVDVDRAVATGRRRVRVRRAVIGVVAAATGLAVVAGTLIALDSAGQRRVDGPAPQVADSAPPSVRAVAACTVRALPVPSGTRHASPTAVDPGGRYVAGYVPGSEETGEQGAALLWDGDRVRDLKVTGFGAAAAAVNRSGVVVGSVNRNHKLVGWVYRDGRVTTLPSFHGRSVTAEDVNDRGDVVGVANGERDINSALVWPAGQPGTVRALTAPGSAAAYVVTDDGTVGGYGNDQQPYVWGPDGVGRQLQNLPAATYGTVFGIAGDWAWGVAGTTGDRAQQRWTVRWNLRDGRVEELPTVEPGAITTTGAVFGTSTAIRNQRPYRTAVSLPAGANGQVPLPHVGTQLNYSTATAGTPDGRVVVGEEATDAATVPVRWTC